MASGLRSAAVVLSAAMLAGCAVSTGPSLPPAAAPYAATTPAQSATFATELAGPATFLPPLPTAVILLRPDDMARNRAFCGAILQLPTARQAEAASVISPNLIRTRWLLQIADFPAARATDCDVLTGTYDYARAARLLASIQPEYGNLSGRGPYLLMIIPDRTGLHVAGLDGSTTPDAAMPAFIATWGQALSQSQARIMAEQPGIASSLFGLVGAVLRAVAGGTVGLISGVLGNV